MCGTLHSNDLHHKTQYVTPPVCHTTSNISLFAMPHLKLLYNGLAFRSSSTSDQRADAQYLEDVFVILRLQKATVSSACNFDLVDIAGGHCCMAPVGHILSEGPIHWCTCMSDLWYGDAFCHTGTSCSFACACPICGPSCRPAGKCAFFLFFGVVDCLLHSDNHTQYLHNPIEAWSVFYTKSTTPPGQHASGAIPEF